MTAPDATLFGSRLSPFVEKTARALSLKRIAFRHVDLRTPFDLKRWNPQTAKMPVVEIGAERVWDSTFILRRLDEIVPEPPFFSADPEAAARERLLEDWIDESLYWSLFALRWAAPNARATTAQLLESFPPFFRPIGKIVLPRQIGRMPWTQGMGRLPYEVLVRELGCRLADLETLLGPRPFFHGDRAGAADVALFGMLHCGLSGPTPEVERLLETRPRLRSHHDRVGTQAPL